MTKRYLCKKKLLIPIKDKRKRLRLTHEAKRLISESLGMLVIGYLIGRAFAPNKDTKLSDVILKAEDFK